MKTVQPDRVAIRIGKRYDLVKKRSDSAYHSLPCLVKTRLISSKLRVKAEELEANSTNKKIMGLTVLSDNLVSHYEIVSNGLGRKWKRSDFFDTDFVGSDFFPGSRVNFRNRQN